MLQAYDLHKSYGRGSSAVQVLTGLDLRVEEGEFVAIMGPSGCGKSTLLHLLGLMTAPDKGEIHLENTRVDHCPRTRTAVRRRRIGIILQRFNLLPELSAMDNVEISLQVRGLRKTGLVDELFEKLGVAHLKGRKPTRMSIGEQQRIAVVRAMAHQPRLLLADEPTGSLDSKNTQNLLEMFARLNSEQRQTIIMITHSADAASIAGRIVRMKDGRLLD